jgi:DNA polymerase III alpha subunit (gram-positive type)
MKVITVDLEMNQPSNNIIQIGAVCTNIKTNAIISSFNCICNPGELPSQFITELTGITTTMVESADPLNICLDKFWKWCKDCGCGMQVWAWGSDVYELKLQSQQLLVTVPTKLRVLNIKEMAKLFRSAKKDLKLSGGLKNTMEVFGLPFIGRQHDAYVDALNTATLLYRFYKIVESYNILSNLVKEEL